MSAEQQKAGDSNGADIARLAKKDGEKHVGGADIFQLAQGLHQFSCRLYCINDAFLSDLVQLPC